MNIQLSKETALFAEALKETTKVYDKVMDAVEAYSNRHCDGGESEEFTKGFIDAYMKMYEEIQGMMTDCINMNVNTEGNKI